MVTMSDKELNQITKEKALSKLKKSIELRNKMGGAMWWNILNDECFKIAEKCIELGVERETITSLL